MDETIPESQSPASSEAAFARLLSLLPDDIKHVLLLEALETCGPSCLKGLEQARDSILHAAVRLEPALLRSVTSYLGHDEEDGDGDADATNADMPDDDDDDLPGGGQVGPILVKQIKPAPCSPCNDADGDAEGFRLN